MSALQIPAQTRKRVYERDDMRCRRCCRGVALLAHSIQHRYARRMGGTSDPRINDLRNLVLMCGSGTTECHGLIERNPAKAEAMGWRITQLSDEQLDRPLVNAWGQVFRLTETGGVLVATWTPE